MEGEPTDNMCSEGFRSGEKDEMVSLKILNRLKTGCAKTNVNE